MAKEIVTPQGGRRALGPYSTAVNAAGLVFCAGVLGWDNDANRLVDGGVAAEAAQALENLRGTLADAGCTPADVVKVTLYVTGFDDMAAVNEVYSAFFAEGPPARTAVAVAALPLGAGIEIDAIAAAPRP